MRLMHAAAFALLVTMAGSPAFAADTLDIPENGYVVSHDLSLLPEAVAAKREALIAVAEAGDMDALAKIFGAEPAPPTVSSGGPDDAIAYLKETSKDGGGLEMLAILADVLEAPYAAMDSGDGKVSYVWPYLAAMEGIGEVATPADKVEGIRLAGYDGFKEIQALGLWYWYRVYIGQDGDLQAFVAGD
jgi:hypothetical protein